MAAVKGYLGHLLPSAPSVEKEIIPTQFWISKSHTVSKQDKGVFWAIFLDMFLRIFVRAFLYVDLI